MADASGAETDAGRVVFAEPGGRWRTVAFGPVLCLVVLVGDLFIGAGVHVFGLTLFAVVLAGLVAVQVAAARRHASVELTGRALRCGTEAVARADIAEVLPAADPEATDPLPWETARALGDLSGVPRRRTAIGLRLADGGLVRAWARDGDGLRTALGEGSAR
ncbi:hypothetical protein ACFYVR_22480 [Rhodococcus sp. NPDC003318]|uniref:hypothetical protein n=1 Tax=Rhodococcus sp. NPDC003318 TaxID=3364503 RepID=UPI003699EC32